MNTVVAIARCTLLPSRRRNHPSFIFNFGSRTLGSTPPLRHRSDYRRPLPIAAFIDLDNVSPRTHRRPDANNFISPILEFERHVNNTSDDTNGLGQNNLLRIEAFGNLSTRSWRTAEEKEHDVTQQDYIPWTPLNNNGGENVADYRDRGRPPPATGVAQTGLDEEGILRCGICGAKMKLTKKDKTRGLTLSDKLKLHMRIHTSEQTKRLTKMKQKKGKNKNKANRNKKMLLNEKDRMKFEKYEAATVGLSRTKQVGVDKRGRPKLATRNDLFRVLRELGVRAKAEDNVDEALISAADRWMYEVARNNKKEDEERERFNNDNYDDGDEDEDDDGDENEFGEKYKGVLLVYSKDGDFVPLLRRARNKGFLAVSATDSVQQTAKVLRNADVVLGKFGRWMEDGETTNLSSSYFDTIPSSFSFKDENDDDADDEYEIRDVSSAPLSLFSVSKPSSSSRQTDDSVSAGVVAVPVSEDGFRFMRGRRQQQQAGGSSSYDDDELFPSMGAENSVKWRLTGDIGKHPSDVDVDDVDSDGESTTSLRGAFPNDGEIENDTQDLSNNEIDDMVEQWSSEEEAKYNGGNSYEEHFVDRENKKWHRRYECKICGHRMKRWNALRKKRFNCQDCTKANRRIGLAKSVVYVSGGESIDHYTFVTGGGLLRKGQISVPKDDKEELRPVPTPKQEIKEHDGEGTRYDASISSNEVRQKGGRRYECKECGHVERRWLKLTKHRLKCTSCTPKNRKLGIKSFLVLPENYDAVGEYYKIYSSGDGDGLFPHMHLKSDAMDDIDVSVVTNDAVDDDVSIKESS